MPISQIRSVLFLVLLSALGVQLAAQETTEFKLKRTKKETVPVVITLLGGYNGVSNPSEKLQDMFENTNFTSWGGLMVALQFAVNIDSLPGGSPLWIGGEMYVKRIATRWLADVDDVYYPGEEDVLVEVLETLGAYGGGLFVALDPFDLFTLQLGAGIQYLRASIDSEAEIVGLFQPQLTPTATVGAFLPLFRYDHGNLSANFRAMWGFGEYGSFEFQSLFGFIFLFE